MNLDSYPRLIADVRALDDAQQVAVREDDLFLAKYLAKCRGLIVERILAKFETTLDDIEYDVENIGFNPVLRPPVRASYRPFYRKF